MCTDEHSLRSNCSVPSFFPYMNLSDSECSAGHFEQSQT